jgi:hypothetical protein
VGLRINNDFYGFEREEGRTFLVRMISKVEVRILGLGFDDDIR